MRYAIYLRDASLARSCAWRWAAPAIRGPPKLASRSAAPRSRAASSEELRALWREVGARSPWGLAVRSSATCEDGTLVSMAGLAESVLGVRGEDALADAVREVWASIASGRALSYLAAHGVRDVGMAVVIQRMVEATAAGVMFTRAPGVRATGAHGDGDERIINAGFGPRRARRQRHHHARRPAHRRPRSHGRLDHLAQAPRDGRRASGSVRDRGRRPRRARPLPRAHRRARGASRPASRSSRTSHGTWSSRATRSARGSCRRARPRAAASPRAATPRPCGAA